MPASSSVPAAAISGVSCSTAAAAAGATQNTQGLEMLSLLRLSLGNSKVRRFSNIVKHFLLLLSMRSKLHKCLLGFALTQLVDVAVSALPSLMPLKQLG